MVGASPLRALPLRLWPRPRARAGPDVRCLLWETTQLAAELKTDKEQGILLLIELS